MDNDDNLDPEISQQLQSIANTNGVLLMGFIAPEKPIKTSPIDFDSASISVDDIYSIEEKIDALQKGGVFPNTLHLIVHTPGGSVYATTKIAKYLRGLFKTIEVYVPYEASSGGTVLCLAADTIVMGPLSNLSPIDPQRVYQGQYVSVNSFNQAVEELEERFGKQRPEQIPSPYQQLCDRIDPVILKEMNKSALDTVIVAGELLQKSQKPLKDEEKKKKIWILANTLARNKYWPHNHIIDIEQAKELGLNISIDEKKIELLKTYKEWVSKRLDVQRATHVIEYFAPANKAPETVEEITGNKNEEKAPAPAKA